MDSSRYDPPSGVDLKENQRGRIIGSCVALWIITDIFVGLRLVSRKLARAGYWVSESQDRGCDSRCMRTLMMRAVGRRSRRHCDGAFQRPLHCLVHRCVRGSWDCDVSDRWKELRHGYGRHIYIWPESERMQKEIAWRREFFVVELFFHTAITICKLSVWVEKPNNDRGPD